MTAPALTTETPTSITARAATTVLFVDDDSATRALFEIFLISFGYSVLIARDGSEALSLIAAHPEIKLMIMDVVMPGISGQELVTKARFGLPNLHVIFCSGHSAPELKDQGIQVQDGHFLQKPCRPGELEKKLKELLTPSDES